MAQEINQLVEAMNAHDLDAVVQLFHSDYHSEQPAHPAREFGTSAQVRANWAAMFGGFRTSERSCFGRLMTATPVGPSGTGGATAPMARPLTCAVSRSSSCRSV